jgi:tellurite resistance protein TehA-like permease
MALDPGCFALVMATGIISNALFEEGRRELSDLLFFANAVVFPWLAILTVLRALRFPRVVWRDLTNPRLVFSFFTIVAGSDVLGVGIQLRGFAVAVLYLWLFALFVWFVLLYFSFGVLTFLNNAHEANVVHGGWLIAIVGTESLVILGALAAHSPCSPPSLATASAVTSATPQRRQGQRAHSPDTNSRRVTPSAEFDFRQGQAHPREKVRGSRRETR